MDDRIALMAGAAKHLVFCLGQDVDNLEFALAFSEAVHIGHQDLVCLKELHADLGKLIERAEDGAAETSKALQRWKAA